MKTKVWTISIRLFHSLLAIGFAVAYILSDFEHLQNLHFAFGLLVGVLLLFRIIYGFTGPKYANFKDFPLSIKNQISFFSHFFKKENSYIGHNPAASVVMICIFIVGLLCSFSGFMLLKAEENAFVHSFFNKDFFEETHEIMANLFLVLVIIHLIGTIADFLFHSHTKTVQSIVTGYKCVEGESTRSTTFHTIYSVLWFIVPFLAFIYGKNLNTENREEKNKMEHHEKNDDDEKHKKHKD